MLGFVSGEEDDDDDDDDQMFNGSDGPPSEGATATAAAATMGTAMVHGSSAPGSHQGPPQSAKAKVQTPAQKRARNV